MGDLSTHFDRKEFRCKCGCGADNINLELVGKLERLRSFLRVPIRVNSGMRCAAYNAEVGGKPNSAHLTGEAADIACVHAHTRFLAIRIVMVWALFNRVGIGKDFLHLDISKKLPPEVMWLY